MGTTPARRVRRHAPPARSVAALLIATLLWAPSVARGAVSPNDEAAAGWLRPVDGAVVAPFDEPVHQYAAGHRGVDFAAAPGTPVRAANDGIVRFAGAVAGSLHVVVGHAGNLRTSSSFLASVAVHQGQAVRRGDVLGMSGGAGPDHGASVLHYGLRIGDRYVDPLQLFRPTDLTALVHLAPTEDPHEGSWSAATEARDLQQSLQLPVPGAATTTGADEGGGCGDGVPIVGGALDAACDLGGWVGSGADDALGAGLDVLDGLTGVADSVLDRLRGPLGETLRQLRELPNALARELARTTTGALVIDLVEMGRRFVGTLAAECSTDAPDADGSGGSAHRVMVVAGINSEGNAGDRGPTVDVDVDALGYHEREGEIRYYSYAADGGPYERDDTHGDLLTAAYRLREQLRAMQLEQPGREVDLLAHSQGGIVTALFLRYFYKPEDATLPPLGNVVTLSSPHEGAPLSTAGSAIRSAPVGRVLLDDVLSRVPAVPPPGSVAVRQLAEDSSTIDDLWSAGVPDHVDLTTIGASEDYVVPADHISVPGASETVVAVNSPNAHSAIVRDPDALRAVRAALEGRAPPCVGVDTALRSAISPIVISRFEHAAGEVVRGALAGPVRGGALGSTR